MKTFISQNISLCAIDTASYNDSTPPGPTRSLHHTKERDELHEMSKQVNVCFGQNDKACACVCQWGHGEGWVWTEKICRSLLYCFCWASCKGRQCKACLFECSTRLHIICLDYGWRDFNKQSNHGIMPRCIPNYTRRTDSTPLIGSNIVHKKHVPYANINHGQVQHII